MKKRYYHNGDGLIVDYYDELMESYAKKIANHKGNEQITYQLLKSFLEDVGIEELLQEDKENCRLLGMSGEREADLLSQVENLKRKIEKLTEEKRANIDKIKP